MKRRYRPYQKTSQGRQVRTDSTFGSSPPLLAVNQVLPQELHIQIQAQPRARRNLQLALPHLGRIAGRHVLDVAIRASQRAFRAIEVLYRRTEVCISERQ